MKMNIWPVSGGALAAGVALVGVIVAQAGGISPEIRAETGKRQSEFRQSHAEEPRFIARASEAMAMQMQMARIAVARASTDAVRDFAARTLVNHAKARAELLQITALDGERAVPLQPPPRKDRVALDKLRAAAVEDFDSLYFSMRLAAQEGALELFDDEAQTGNNSDLRRFARAMLPVLGNELRKSQALAETLPARSPKLAGEPRL